MAMGRQESFGLLERGRLEALIERLHRLFVANLDPKAFDLYIEPQVKDRDTGEEYSAFQRLTDFIKAADSASLLLAGDPGMGKTLLSLQMAQRAWHLFIQENLGGLLSTKNAYWHEVLAQLQAEVSSVESMPAISAEKAEGSSSTLSSWKKSVQNLFSKARVATGEPRLGGITAQEQNAEEEKVSSPAHVACLPLWIWMPFLRTGANWRNQLLETYANQSGLLPDEIQLLKKACQLKVCQLLPIMDGWDELPPGVVNENLYLRSRFWTEEGWPYVKVLSTCRPEAFIHYEKSQGSYRSIFHPPRTAGSYTILNLSPFETRHIKAYVQRYLGSLSPDYVPTPLALAAPSEEQAPLDKAKEAWLADYEKYTANTVSTRQLLAEKEEKQDGGEEEDLLDLESKEISYPSLASRLPQAAAINWHSAATYLRYLEQIPGLSNLVKTPFILSAVVQVLPTIVLHEQQYKNHDVSRYVIYQYFVEHWLTKQAARLWSDKEKRAALPEFKAETDEASIAKLKSCLLTYSENLARLALNLGAGKINVNLTEEDTSHASLVIPPPGQAHYFEKEPVEKNKLQLIRSGCLLKNVGNNFKFLHKSLVEYFAAKMLFKGAHTMADYYLHRFDEHHSFTGLDLNDHLLTTEPSVIYLLADKAREDIHFKYLLYQMIELSKGEPSVANAAANAITILNAAGESFSGRDFRGIQIPGAILNGSLVDHANLEGADLKNVTAHHACLASSNLSHSHMQGFDFQELPRIKHPTLISALCMSPTGEWLLLGDAKGYVTQYNYPEGKLLQQWYRKSQSIMGKTAGLFDANVIISLALRSDGRLAACGGIDGTAQLIHIQKHQLGARFVPTVISRAAFLQINMSATSSMTFCSEEGRYLAFHSEVKLEHTRRNGEDYKGNHLQIWDIRQKRFLGEYQPGSSINLLATCNQGSTLLAGYGDDKEKKVAIFSLINYSEGMLTPVKILEGGCLSLSRNEQCLALTQANTIQLYQTQDWAGLNAISLKNEQEELQALSFSPKGDLLAGRSQRQVHLWDLSSGQHLYALPIPEGIANSRVNSLHFVPVADELRVLLTVKDTIHIWPLSRAGVSIAYPRRPISLSVSFLEKTEFSGSIDSDSFSAQSSEKEGKVSTTITIIIHNKSTSQTQYLSYQLSIFKSAGNISPLLAFSPHQNYLVTRATGDSGVEDMMGIGKIGSFMSGFMDTTIRVWDLKRQELCWTVTHPIPCSNILFSEDGQWLIHGTQEVFINRLEDGKQLFQLTTGSCVSALALAVNNHWLAVADVSGSLSIFDLKTQQRLWHIPDLPIIIRSLDLTVDSQFLVAKGKKEGELIFRVLQEGSNVNLKLISNTMELNLACADIRIEATQHLSQDNLQLLQQNNAQGTPAVWKNAPAPDEDKQVDDGGSPIPTSIIPREFCFDRVVVKRGNVMSFLNPRAVLDYSLWQVALVRDSKSNNNNQHTFVVVEGMDAFGRCFFLRFDLATSVGKEKVKEGFAQVIINERKNFVLSERKAMLENFLNPHGLEGRGLESLVGHVWQLKREVVLQLYRDVLDDTQSLLPYAKGGNQSFFSRGDSCYSWARRRLLALKQPKIEKQLPSNFMNYIAMVPSWRLTKSLSAAPAAAKQPVSS